MAYVPVPENPDFPDVYQIETSDRVLGGVDGIANIQARQLAERDAYLSEQIDGVSSMQAEHQYEESNPHPMYISEHAAEERIAAAIAALAGSPPATLNTLAKLAAAINNDPAFFQTIDYRLEFTAPLNSPTFLGTPRAVTPASGDNSTRLSTTAFVRTEIAALLASAPAALDTLNELATALGNDPNFAATINNALAAKLNSNAYTAADVLSKLKSVDGVGSDLDADLLDGLQSGFNGNNIVLRTDSAGALLLDNWLRVSNTTGLISPDGGKFFRDGAYWALHGNSTAATSLNLRTSDNVSRAHFYAISNDFGFLNGAGSWSLRYESGVNAWRSYGSSGFITEGWFQSESANGWINKTHGGGIHMRDSDAVRVYGGKNFTLEFGSKIGLAHTYSGGIGPYIRAGDNWNVRLGSDLWGYVEIGPQNGSYCHYSTTISSGHLFNAPVLAQGGFQQYSTRRRKFDIADLNYGIDTLMQLKPVSFRYTEKPDRVHLGFIAEDVADIIHEPIISDKDGLPETMDYDQLLAVIVSGVQQFAQHTNDTIEQLRNRIATLEAERA